MRVARTDGVEEKARVVGEAAKRDGVAEVRVGRKTAGARKRRIEEANMMCGCGALGLQGSWATFWERYRGVFSAMESRA